MHETNKFKVFWWIRGVGGLLRKSGHDIISTNIDFFDETEAEELIQKDLEAQIPLLISGSAGHFSIFASKAEEGYTSNFPNFIEAHKEVTDNSISGSVSNWGIKKIVEIEEFKNR